MKKWVLILVAAFFVYGQGLSAYLGGNASLVTIENEVQGASDPEGEQGLILGAAYDVDLWVFYLSAGVNYTSTNFKFFDATDVYSVEHSELQFPVMLKMGLFPWVVKPYLQAGVVFTSGGDADVKGELSGKGKAETAGVTYFAVGGGVNFDLPIPLIPVMFADVKVLFNAPDYFKNSGDSEVIVNQAQVTLGVRF